MYCVGNEQIEICIQKWSEKKTSNNKVISNVLGINIGGETEGQRESEKANLHKIICKPFELRYYHFHGKLIIHRNKMCMCCLQNWIQDLSDKTSTMHGMQRKCADGENGNGKTTPTPVAAAAAAEWQFKSIAFCAWF